MIRGINKRIIEITDTGSDYFEKALLFVNTGTEIGDDILRSEAERLLDIYSVPNSGGGMGYLRYHEVKEKKNRLLKKVILGAALFIVCGIITFFMLIR